MAELDSRKDPEDDQSLGPLLKSCPEPDEKESLDLAFYSLDDQSLPHNLGNLY